MSGTPSELATSEMPVSEAGDGEATPVTRASTFPPYPPYATEPAPPSVADTIIAGHDLRLQHKSKMRKPIRPLPKPARPRGPKATDVKMPKHALRAHARCLRKHGAILTDRLERMAKPQRRNIIYLWREHAFTLPPETIARLRALLDADEPFKPDQAYEYFINLKKTKKKVAATERVNEIKKDMLAMCNEKRFLWARNATVAFARGIQQRLSRPGRYALADGMLRLSNIILDEICGYMHMRTPSRRCTHPKAKFMMEMSDKVAVWIDEILSESDDRMLMMDFDEDDDILRPARGAGGDDARFADDFLDMMGDGALGLLNVSQPAHKKFKGNMKKAFDILTDAMDTTGGDGNLISLGKFQQTYREAADALKKAPDLKATEYSTKVAEKIKKKLTALTNDITPPEVTGAMKDMVEICSNYLAQNAEFNKKKGPAFKFLVNAMRNKPDDKMYQKGKVQRTYAEAATDLEQAEGLDADHDDPNLSQEIHSAMTRLVKGTVPDEMKKDMAETVDVCSKYLSQKAVDDNERGPAFDFLIKQLDTRGAEPFSDYPALSTKNAAAYVLKSAPGLKSIPPDPSTADEFKKALHKAVDTATPREMIEEMKDVIDGCGDYLSAFIRDRGPAMDILLEMMENNPTNVFAKRNDYTMDYETAAEDIKNAPTLVPFLPVKDIAEEGKANLTRDMKEVTPPKLKVPMEVLIKDASKYLSQPVAMRSGVAGDRYAMNFLAAVKKSLGTKPLYKYKSYGQTYADAADDLQNAGPLESVASLSSGMNLQARKQLESAMNLLSQQKLESKQNLSPQQQLSVQQQLSAQQQLSPQQQLSQQQQLSPQQKLTSPLKPSSQQRPPLEELSKSTVDLGHQIASEMKRGVPTQLAPTIAEDLQPTMDKAAKHLAKLGSGKGKAMEYVVDRMKDKGEDKLAKLQGYDQTYTDGARRLEKTPTLAKDKVDKAAYETVKDKLTEITKDKPAEKFAEHIPGIVDDSAKFLAAPFPETRAEKRQVLGDLMGRKEDKILGEEGAYKMTYKEGAEEIQKAPVGVTTAHNEKKKKEIVTKLEAVIPDKKMAEVLKESTNEGAAHLTDAIEGRGQAMDVIQDSLRKEKKKEFIDVGAFKKDHKQIADMIEKAPNLKSDNPSPVILENVEHKLAVLQKDIPADKPMAKEHMDDASKIAAEFIATKATKESGLDAGELKALDEAGFNAEAKAAAEARRRAAVEAGPSVKKGDAGVDGQDGGAEAKKKRARGAGAEEEDTDAQGRSAGAKKRAHTKAGGAGGEEEDAEGGAGAKKGSARDKRAGFGGFSAEAEGPGGTGGKPVSAADKAADASSAKYGPGGSGPGPGGTGSGPGGAGSGPGGGGLGPGGAGAGPVGTGQAPGSAGYGPDGAGYGPSGASQVPGVAAGGGPGGAPGATSYAPGAAGYGPDGAARGPGGAAHGPSGAAYKSGGPDYGPPGETEEQRRRRLAEAEAYRKHEEEERRRLGDKEYFKRQAEKWKGSGKYHGGALGSDYDPEHEAALDILHRELQARGSEIFYQQPQTALTHRQASEWLAAPNPMRVDKSVRDSGDTARLHKKFERKLNAIVSEKTPPQLYECMQDVVIEGARRLAEFFVSTSYNALVNDALISEMQKRGNEILTEVDGAAETHFFASQRLKKADTLHVQEPCYQVANDITKKLDDVIRTRPMARKLNTAMKDHIKEASNFLSAVVTKPDDQIEAYIALLDEMEAAGDSVLIDGDIPKTYGESAAYLRQLTSYEDKIKRPNRSLQATVQNRLQSLMSYVPPSGYSPAVMDSVIAECAGLLVSYVMLQAEKTEALKILVEELKKAGESVLLRHGTIRKSYKEGADLLRGKTTDQLSVPTADPVVARKIQIKLNNLMQANTPVQYQELMDDVIEDVTMYLAVQLLQPQLIKVCKCYKNVFVQCELWCDEILRRVARPCCTCSRHVSVQALQDLAPAQLLRVTPSHSRVFAPGAEMTFKACPKQANTLGRGEEPEIPKVCPAENPTPGCHAQGPTTSYLLYSTTHKRFGYDSRRLSSEGTSSSASYSPMLASTPLPLSKPSSPLKSLLRDIHIDNIQFFQQQQEKMQSGEIEKQMPMLEETTPSYLSSASTFYNFGTTQQMISSYTSQQYASPIYSSVQISETSKISQAKSGYSSRTPIVSADQMADWHAMMVSLMWNVQAWRDWIQEIVDRALAYQYNPNVESAETADTWSSFHRRISTEALQWRQYSVFSRQLTTRLHLRYRDKQILSPKRSTVKTKTYIECQEEMLDIIDMFNRWTQWLTLVVRETDSLQQSAGFDTPLHQMRWNHFKKKVEGYSKDWSKYNLFLKVSWEQKYSAVIADYLPAWKKHAPVWVVSASGAVPSGAVAAGVYDGEVIWVARTTHRCKVLPAALYPSKHCCVVYSEGTAHRYTKYQVMCNAEVRWVGWRGGSVGGRAVRVAAGVHVGRVHYRGNHLLGAVHEPHYRCHVVIFGRPFAFNCYELLMLAGDGDQ